MRDYDLMRQLLFTASKDERDFGMSTVMPGKLRSEILPELKRLQDDGLVHGNLAFDESDEYAGGDVSGLTEEGHAFFKLIENVDAWTIMRSTLEKAGIDISYQLLKEVCEEVVKRYVTSFIPEIRKDGR